MANCLFCCGIRYKDGLAELGGVFMVPISFCACLFRPNSPKIVVSIAFLAQAVQRWRLTTAVGYGRTRPQSSNYSEGCWQAGCSTLVSVPPRSKICSTLLSALVGKQLAQQRVLLSSLASEAGYSILQSARRLSIGFLWRTAHMISPSLSIYICITFIYTYTCVFQF